MKGLYHALLLSVSMYYRFDNMSRIKKKEGNGAR